MVDVELPAVASAIGQVASAVVAVPAAIVAYFAWKAARSAAAAAEALTAIEHRRLQAEMLPTFEIGCQRPNYGIYGELRVWLLRLRLVGPPALPYVDKISVFMHHFDAGWPFKFASGPGADVDLFEERTIEDLRFGGEAMLIIAIPKDGERHVLFTGGRVTMTMRCEVRGYDPWLIPVSVRLPGLILPLGPHRARERQEGRGDASREGG